MHGLPEFLDIRTDIPCVGNAFNVPKEIGCFSVKVQNEQMKIQNDDTMKKYYFRRQYSKQDKFNLNDGYDESFKLYPFADEKVDNVLNWIMNEKKFQPVMSEDCLDFVTSRGTIKKILYTPFCKGKFNRWRIYASKFRKTIYLIAIDTEEKIVGESNPTEGSLKKAYWGKKFEQYMTTEDPKVEPDLSSKCYESGLFCIIATNKIGDHKLLFRAEMDALKSDPKHPGDTSQYVELKICHCGRLLHSYAYKPLKIWSQCIPVGVEDIVCGFYLPNGILESIHENKTEKLPKIQKSSRKFPKWTPNACFNFCNYFLNFLKENLKDDHKSVLRFDYGGEDKIQICPENDKKFQIIPDNFVEKFLSKESVSQSESPREQGGRERKKMKRD